MTTPALPPGFVLVDNQAAAGDPPLPPGFVEQSAEMPDFSGVRGTFRRPEPDRLIDALPSTGPASRALAVAAEDAIRAGAHHFGSAFHGGAQAIEHGVGWLADQVLPGDDVATLVGGEGSIGQRARRAIRDTIAADDAALRQREADYQAQVPDSVAASAGAVGGAILPFALSGGRLGGNITANALRGANLPAWLARAAGGAVEGGVGAAAAPVLGDDFAGEKATQVVLGAGLGGALPIVGNIARGFKPFADFAAKFTERGATRAAAEQIRDEATDLARVMTPNASQVPGVQRTLAEESLDPGVSRLQQHLRGQRGGGVLSDRDTLNNAARVDEIRRFAGDEDAIEAAKRARDAVASPLRDTAEASNAVVDTSTALAKLENAINKKEGFDEAQTVLRELRERLYRPSTAAEKQIPGWPDFVPRDDVRTLYNVRRAITNWLSKDSDKPAAKAAEVELLAMRDELDDALEAASPEFAAYMDAFRAGSRDVNRLQFGRELLEGGAGKNVPDALENPTLSPAAFGGQTGTARRMQRTAKAATGFSKADPATFLQPEDFAGIRAIRDDLRRVGNVTRQGLGASSPTTPLKQIEERLQQSVLANLPFGVGKFAGALATGGDAKVLEKLIVLVQNPEQARAALAALPPRDAATLADVLARLSGLAGNTAANAVEVDVVGGTPASRAEVERDVQNIRPR